MIIDGDTAMDSGYELIKAESRISEFDKYSKVISIQY
jgi:hypothetical protein